MMENIRVERDARGVVQIFLCRAEVRNALNPYLIDQIRRALDVLNSEGDARILVLRGEGRDFCVGADLQWMRDMSVMKSAQIVEESRPLQLLFHEIEQFPLPVIGVAHGYSMAGGLGILAGCDAVIATADAHFCLSETRIGLIPALVAPFLVRKMGYSWFRFMAVTTEFVDAKTMHMAGIVHRIVKTDDLDDELEKLIAKQLRVSPQAVSMLKKMLADINSDSSSADLHQKVLKWVAISRGEDCAVQGVAAFLEKRPPPWDHSFI
jgi:methylglutaconyl-CoA hydratase